ncbi:MAG: CDP-diacylglycerol--glycerol-3-phosphate 3-phosphatidyltransferase [Rhodanobacteraceae bacterium]|nr:MAG: CDP-diacylglycerol--glycerol-3-phosphate 3-phosphatidyltransferase [Rhodanobacteraceae bacterium]
MRINLPTWLTLFRVLLLPVMVVVFYSHDAIPMIPLRAANIAAVVVFALASVTDWLDGWIARRWHMESAFGAFLDPVADKLMIAVTLFILVQAHPTALLAVTSAVIVGREITVSALREWMAFVGERGRVKVQWIGKLKTVMQIVAILILLWERDKDATLLRAWYAGEVLLVIAAILTIWSGLAYLRAAWPVLKSGRMPGDDGSPEA